MVTYKVCDTCDSLTIGASYTAVPSGRMIAFTNIETGTLVHVWPHDVQRALYRGALRQQGTDNQPITLKH